MADYGQISTCAREMDGRDHHLIPPCGICGPASLSLPGARAESRLLAPSRAEISSQDQVGGTGGSLLPSHRDPLIDHFACDGKWDVH